MRPANTVTAPLVQVLLCRPCAKTEADPAAQQLDEQHHRDKCEDDPAVGCVESEILGRQKLVSYCDDDEVSQHRHHDHHDNIHQHELCGHAPCQRRPRQNFTVLVIAVACDE